jgi:hypothetical protein
LSLEHGKRRLIVDDQEIFFGTVYIMPWTEIIVIFKMTLPVAVSNKAPLHVTELKKIKCYVLKALTFLLIDV